MLYAFKSEKCLAFNSKTSFGQRKKNIESNPSMNDKGQQLDLRAFRKNQVIKPIPQELYIV